MKNLTHKTSGDWMELAKKQSNIEIIEYLQEISHLCKRDLNRSDDIYKIDYYKAKEKLCRWKGRSLYKENKEQTGLSKIFFNKAYNASEEHKRLKDAHED